MIFHASRMASGLKSDSSVFVNTLSLNSVWGAFVNAPSLRFIRVHQAICINSDWMGFMIAPPSHLRFEARGHFQTLTRSKSDWRVFTNAPSLKGLAGFTQTGCSRCKCPTVTVNSPSLISSGTLFLFLLCSKGLVLLHF